MFAKALILVLLGSSLVLGAPLASPGDDTTPASSTLSDTISNWLSSTWNTLKGFWDYGTEAVKDALNDIKSNMSDAKDLGKEIYDNLMQKGEEITKRTREAVKAEREKWEKKLKELKEKASETGEALTEKMKELKDIAAKAINDKIADGQRQWEDWKKEAYQAYANASAMKDNKDAA